MRTGWTEPVGGEVSRRFVALLMGHEGRFGVRVELEGALGRAEVEADVERNGGGAMVLHWNVQEEIPVDVVRLVEELRSQADAFVFLSGGASNMSEGDSTALFELFRSLEMLASRGLRFAVGDGGTKAGIMEAAGRARAASRNVFPLLGIAPAPEVGIDGRSGATPIEEHHSHILTITNEPWLEAQKKKGWEPSWGFWGSETETMYEVFGRLADGRSSV
ncbi:MAG: hypothetical protein ACRD21_08715, partial [Vicinamibacteria bacterium]